MSAATRFRIAFFAILAAAVIGEAQTQAATPSDSIHIAVLKDDADAIHRWLSKDLSLLNVKNNEGMTPLHLAVAKYRRRAFDVLIASGADVKLTTGACRMSIDARAGKLVFREPREKWTALHIAAFADRIDLAEVLIAQGADIDAVNDRGETPLLLAAQTNHAAMAALLIKHGANPNAAPKSPGLPPLPAAVFEGHHDLARQLLANGAVLDPLSAAGLGMTEKLETLIKENPRLIVPAKRAEHSLVYWAAKFGRFETLQLLLKRKAPFEFSDDDGRTPLILLAMGGYARAAELLIAASADVNARDHHGMTPLHHAAANGHTAMIVLLKRRGAKLGAKDNKGRTPLDVAVAHKRKNVIDLLEQAGAKPASRDEDKRRTRK